MGSNLAVDFLSSWAITWLSEHIAWILIYTNGLIFLYFRTPFAFLFLAGATLNMLLGKLLKKLIGHERPGGTLRGGEGMPSSHANCLFYFAANLSLILHATFSDHFSAVKSMQWLRHRHALLWLLIFLMYYWSLVISLARVYGRYRHHTIPQVLAGLILGTVSGVVWYYHVLIVYA